MNYRLTVRGFEDQDVDNKCPYSSEEGDLDMYLNSLVEDIESINEVSDVVRDDCFITIKLDEPVSKETLLEHMKPFFTDRRVCEYKYVSLEML